MELLMRDNKSIESFLKEKYKKIKEMSLFRNLKKEVETGASGTQDYVIKKGPNKDKIAKKQKGYYGRYVICRENKKNNKDET